MKIKIFVCRLVIYQQLHEKSSTSCNFFIRLSHENLSAQFLLYTFI